MLLLIVIKNVKKCKLNILVFFFLKGIVFFFLKGIVIEPLTAYDYMLLLNVMLVFHSFFFFFQL